MTEPNIKVELVKLLGEIFEDNRIDENIRNEYNKKLQDMILAHTLMLSECCGVVN